MRGGGKDLQIWHRPPGRRPHAKTSNQTTATTMPPRAAEGAEQHPRPLLAGEPAVASPSKAAASASVALCTEAEQQILATTVLVGRIGLPGDLLWWRRGGS